jgi:hypothetical protein
VPTPRKPPIDTTAYGCLPSELHEEVVNLTDGFVGIVDDAVASDLGCAIAGPQLLHIDLDELYRLWRASRSDAAERRAKPIIAALGRTINSFIVCFPWPVARAQSDPFRPRVERH